jgi:ubiquinone biosynthesis protein UbiJ
VGWSPFTGAAVADYRTPLPALLAGFLEAAVNRVLALDPDAVARLARLEGKTLQVNLEGLGIELYFTFDYGSVQVQLDSNLKPDTVVSGSPVALFAMAAPEEIGDWGLPGSGVRIEGDARLAQDIGKLFSRLQPDWEGPLAELLGDTLGFQVASGLRQGAEAVREAAQTTAELATGYFRDESGLLVPPSELRAFSRAVDDLNDAVDRLQARIGRLGKIEA